MRLIKEMRLATGMSQSQFAKKYNIPVSTLRKWEQGESRPPAYVVELISNTIPSDCDGLVKITASNGKDYYIDTENHVFKDSLGNSIPVNVDITDVNRHNLGLYLNDMFQAYYDLQEKFKRDCEYDKKEHIVWSDWECE